MIFAEISGKLRSDGTAAFDRSEDIFTSTVFGLLRYVDVRVGLIPILRRARRVRLDGNKLIWTGMQDEFCEVSSFEIQFWPSFAPFGQPDILITLRDSDAKPMHVLIIEVKLYSPKSGCADDVGDEVSDVVIADEEVPDPDQLVKYWQGLKRLELVTSGCPTSLVYLTSHSAAPTKDLSDALGRSPGICLAWISWFDVCEVLAESLRENLSALPLHDLLILLRHKGFGRFNGFVATPPPFVPNKGFWSSARNLGSASNHAKAAAKVEASRTWFKMSYSGVFPDRHSFWRET